jgi:hypothetical protein
MFAEGADGIAVIENPDSSHGALGAMNTRQKSHAASTPHYPQSE